LLNARAGYGGVPLISVDRDTYELQPPPPDSSAGFQRFREMWHGLWWTYQTMIRPVKRPQGRMIAEAIYIAFKVAATSVGLRADLQGDPSDHLFPNNSKFSLVADGSTFLSTWHLFESQAIVTEMLCLIAAYGDARRAQSLVPTLTDPDYSYALNLFARLTQLDISTVLSEPMVLRTFLVVVDLALNPPVPPIDLWPERRSFSWRDWYPPHRFVAASRAAARLGVLPQPCSNQVIEEYLHSLSVVSGISYVTPATHSYLLRPDSRDYGAFTSSPTDAHVMYTHHHMKLGQFVSDIPEKVAALAAEPHTPFDFILWLQSQFWKQRSRNIASVLFPSDSWMRLAIADDTFDRFITLRGAIWDSPIIGVDETRRFTIGMHVAPELAWWLAFWSAVSAALHETLVEVGPLRVGDMPSSLQPGSPLFRVVEDNLRIMLSIPRNTATPQ
jgi:hypothetical protein